jgi:serine/threonine protein kinase
MPHLSAALSDRYVIEREIGAGGMAVVYLAHDRKLDREVALKVLRPELGAVLGAERFLAEIKISARLDHPHLLTVIDSGDAEGVLYYVLPYVRGETLREKLQRERQLPIDEAVEITKQVASALDYAHRQGLVHRDIKPENILIQEGKPILSDFGIALAVKEAGGNRLTQTGLSLGTPQYMSPEQATGDRVVDARSDVYSLAAVLYEMLAGEPPVTGSNAQVMIAKLMTEKPTRLRTVRDTVPEHVDAALAKALAKTPADRFTSAGDFVRALESPLVETQAVRWPVGSKGRIPVVAGVAAIALILAVAGYALRHRLFPPSVVHATLGRKTQLTSSGDIREPAISPDGKQLAFVKRVCDKADCTFSVTLQDVGGTTRRTILDGATAAYTLQWSPDRRNLLFDGAVDGRSGWFLISALGGPPRWVTQGAASFYADGDSLLLGPPLQPDSSYWVRVAGLDGGVRDSVPIHGPGQGLASLSEIPGTRWILSMVYQPPHGLWQITGRDGKVADQVVNACTCGGIGTRDAIWLTRVAGPAGHAVVRIPIDRRTGRISDQQDTMLFAHMSNVSVTADGMDMVIDEGTAQFDTWAASLDDVLHNRLADDRRVVHAFNSAFADVSPDGARLLYRRVEVTPQGDQEERFSVGPFAGGSESPLPFTDPIDYAGWMDSVSVAISAERHGVTSFDVVDVRNGATRNHQEVKGTVYSWTPLPDGWAWQTELRRFTVERKGQERVYDLPRRLAALQDLESSPARADRLFVEVLNTARDSVALEAVNLDDGSFTRWFAAPAVRAQFRVLADGTLFVEMYRTQSTLDLYHVTAPGTAHLLGRAPRPGSTVTVSDDLKRATVSTSESHADAWMYRVVKN